MIDMGVRDDDRLHAQLMLLQNRQDSLDLVARIDHHRFPALLVAKDRAVTLQNTHWKDLVNHNSYTRIMDSLLRAVLAVCMRWIHITSVVTLIGGFIYARFALTPALESVAEPLRGQVGEKAVASFRSILYTVLATAL